VNLDPEKSFGFPQILIFNTEKLFVGRDLTRELHDQVMEYTIHSSMFDCVLVATIR